jgi:two-component system, response regulator YesN
MLRVMIVDDEPVIRYGIKASVDWEREGFRVVGDFANGADALRSLETEPADILITDIKMPVMDGLELTRRALALYPQLKVILVSSYNDFEYVREGLKLGVADYILKPTLEPEDLLQLVRKCEEQIRENERLENRLRGVQAVEAERNRRMYEHGLKRFLVHRAEHLLEGGYPLWLDGRYLGVYGTLHRTGALGEKYGFLHKSIALDAITDVFYERYPRGVALPFADSELFFLLPADEKTERALVNLQEAMAKESGTGVSFGCAEGTGSGALMQVFQQSLEACRHCFFAGEGIYCHGRIKEAVPQEPIDLPNLLQASPEPGDARLMEWIESWRLCYRSGGKTPLELKEQACKVLSVLFKQNADPYVLVEAFDRLYQAETLDELCALLQEQIAELHKLALDKLDHLSAHNPVAKALEYIRSHYLETLTLQQVADYVHVSKNYFSILFKKTTEQNFIDFVINLRIQRAKELLADKSLKIYEVAEQSGFNDVKYFSKLFKKITGFSPIDYREFQGSYTAQQ